MFSLIITIVSDIITLVSTGTTLYTIFSGSQLNINQLVADLQTVITNVIRQEVETAAINDAQGVLTAGQDFITTDYQNAVNSGESSAQIYALLTVGEGGEKLNDLTNQAGTMQAWSVDSDEAVQTLPLYLLLTSMILAFYQAQAKYAPDEEQTAAALKNVQDYAGTYSARANDVYQWIFNQRISAVKSANSENEEWYFRDGWIGDHKMLKAYTSIGQCEFDADQIQARIVALQQGHVALLKSGSQVNYDYMMNLSSLSDVIHIGLGCPPQVGDFNAYFGDPAVFPPSGGYVMEVVDFGLFAAQMPAAIQTMQSLIQTPLPPANTSV
jgi:hypothetical protein